MSLSWRRGEVKSEAAQGSVCMVYVIFSTKLGNQHGGT